MQQSNSTCMPICQAVLLGIDTLHIYENIYRYLSLYLHSLVHKQNEFGNKMTNHHVTLNFVLGTNNQMQQFLTCQ